MKKLFALFLFAISSMALFSQTIPSCTLKDADGKEVDVQSLIKENKTILFFWATWDTHSTKGLSAMNDLYATWQEKYQIQIIAVCVDDNRTSTRAAKFVETKKTEMKYTYLFDTNHKLSDLLKKTGVPIVLLVNPNGEIVFEKTGFNVGDEFEIDEKVKEIFKK